MLNGQNSAELGQNLYGRINQPTTSLLNLLGELSIFRGPFAALEAVYNYGTGAQLNPHLEAGILVTDNELIGRYLFKGDKAALEELIVRHSSLVMGVCRGMLMQTQDAEDAFQATFLILSRKCKSLLNHGSVAGWLY